MSQIWTTEQIEVIEWLATPKRNRKPKTQQALARKLGVSRETLSRWKRLPGFGDAVYSEARRCLDGRLPAILDRLGDRAEEGDLAAIRLTLEVTGRYVETRALDVRGTVAMYQAEEFAAAAAFLDEWERKRADGLEA